MRLLFSERIRDCIYPKNLCLLIKDRGDMGYPGMFGMSEDEYDRALTKCYHAIWGDDIPTNVKLANDEKLNECTAYTFYEDERGLHPVRATASAKTLANFERQKRKFWHDDY